MGALSNGGTDLALQVATGTLTGLDDAGAGVVLRGNFNVSVWGTFVATVALERSFDGGTTWIRVTFSDGGILAYTAPASAVWSEAEYGVMFRLRCTAYTSGTVHWRLSLGSDAATATPVNISDGAPNILPNAPLNILASTYNAATNSPAIANNGTGAGAGANNAYVVAVAGTVTVDSIGAVSIGDIIFNSGGTKWLRAPYSAVYKTMSLQDADDVAITGGTVDGLDRLSLSGDDEFRSIAGAYPFEIVDENGMISSFVDTDGVWNMYQARINSVSGTAGVITLGDIDVAETADDVYDVVDRFGFSSLRVREDGSVDLPNASFSYLTPAYIALFEAKDASGNVTLGWDADAGTVDVPGAQFANSSTLVALEIVDEFGFSAGYIKPDGETGGVFSTGGTSSSGGGSTATGFSAVEIAARDGVALGQSALVLSQSNTAVMRPTKNYNIILGYGQSLSVGSGGTPVLSTTQPYDSLRLGGSTLSSDATGTTFVPFTDSLFHALTGSTAETVSLALTNQWRKQQLQWRAVDLDATRLFVTGDCGVGSRAIEQLSKGASPEVFNRLRSYVTQVQSAVTAVGGGKTMGIAAFTYIQGENNYIGPSNGYDDTESGYRAKLLQLYDDVCSDVVDSTAGQDIPPAMFVCQTSSGWDIGDDVCAIGMAQLNASLENPNIYLVGPNYYTPDNGTTGATHPTNEGYRWLGLQFGKVMHKVLDKGEGWKPLYPTRASFRDNQILVEFHVPEPPLAFDLPYFITTPTDYDAKGFNPYDDFGAIPVESVEIAGAATVLITLSRETKAEWSPGLQYAGKATFEGSGCLRDSDPTQSGVTFSLTGEPFPLYNWCVAFNISVVEAD